MGLNLIITMYKWYWLGVGLLFGRLPVDCVVDAFAARNNVLLQP
ncbi:unnamed protein product [Tenebrio molitor]|nr:unnamed protein product [Tenebrio molitor]